MKTLKLHRHAVTHNSETRCSPCVLLLSFILTSIPLGSSAEDRFQMNALFNPSQAQLRAEERGHIMIYDNLDSEDVERALDQQYERIENMMFTRIRHSAPDGAVSVEDDGC